MTEISVWNGGEIEKLRKSSDDLKMWSFGRLIEVAILKRMFAINQEKSILKWAEDDVRLEDLEMGLIIIPTGMAGSRPCTHGRKKSLEEKEMDMPAEFTIVCRDGRIAVLLAMAVGDMIAEPEEHAMGMSISVVNSAQSLAGRMRVEEKDGVWLR